MNFVDSQHCKSFAHCYTCRTDKQWRLKVGAPEQCPVGYSETNLPKPRLGNIVESLVKPIAKMIGMPCLDQDDKLNVESPCAKRRDKLNEIKL